MELRAATETDIPGIRDVASRSLAASYDDVLDAESRQRAVETWYGTEGAGAFAEELAGERTVVIVAEEDGEILGFAQAFVSGDEPVTGQIEWLHVRLAGDHVPELTLVAENGIAEPPVERTEHRETDDGETVLVAYDERERGSEGPFHPTFLDEEREEPYGWYCGAYGSLDVNVGSMDEFVCDDCGNRRRPMRWDAAYGG